MSKAEKFENEKKRIIESCFAKKDSDGSGTSNISHKQRPVLRPEAAVGDLEDYVVAEHMLCAVNITGSSAVLGANGVVLRASCSVNRTDLRSSADNMDG